LKQIAKLGLEGKLSWAFNVFTLGMAQATQVVINENIKMLLYIACKIIHKNNGIYRLIINYKN
jgi:hypothetical protein